MEPPGDLHLPCEESRGAGADLLFLVTTNRASGMAWRCVRGGSYWMLGRSSSLRGCWVLEQAPFGSGRGTKAVIICIYLFIIYIYL